MISSRLALHPAAAALCLLLGPPLGAAGSAATESVYAKDDLSLIVKTQELKLSSIDTLLSFLDIKPGMTILDIGAGTGQQAYKMADRLHGTGRVFATDIEPQLVDYVSKQARSRKLDNLQAVLVRSKGFDPFYDEHRYDLVLFSNSLHYIDHIREYLGRLRERLSPSGRVVVVGADADPLFYDGDFEDWKGFVSELRREPLWTPFGRALKKPLQPLLNRDDGQALKSAAIGQLNMLLASPFFVSFTTGLDFKPDVSFTPEERAFALWVLHRLKLGGVPGESISNLRFGEWRLVQVLNKLLIIQRFRKRLSHQGQGPYLSNHPIVRWELRNDFLIGLLESTGYRLEAKHSLIPFQAVWVFAKGR